MSATEKACGTSWPITRHYKDRHWAFVAAIKTGVIVFCVADWGRGDVEICGRAKGYLAGRGLTSIHALGTCQEFGDECYPDFGSALLRWPDIAEFGIGLNESSVSPANLTPKS
jgi:hypothetical protein